ncbi:hypothetical protein D9619_010679 [Psilocybe cf. subviscida]|uniref:BTB domain-containing protein n=1 Tax=Psilocybe cf. subviscida TaxID=2480587 RepID=A0A8H5B8Q4_9AGAR|nr:hypothetical protein D9619_010679 [Psilocybe cf. subviscida]
MEHVNDSQAASTDARAPIAKVSQHLPSDKNETRSNSIVFDDFFNFELIYLNVDDVIFTAHKEWFMEPGCCFKHLFSMPVQDPSNIEGSRPETPLVLNGTTTTDFRSFLCALYPQARPNAKYEEWIGALRLATRWDFVNTRNKSISALNLIIGLRPSYDKVNAGIEFRVANWLKEGLQELVQKDNLDPDTLTSEPYSLNWKTAARLLYAQVLYKRGEVMRSTLPMRQNMQCIACNVNYGISYGQTWCCRSCGAGSEYSPQNLVKKNFPAELQDAVYIPPDASL